MFVRTHLAYPTKGRCLLKQIESIHGLRISGRHAMDISVVSRDQPIEYGTLRTGAGFAARGPAPETTQITTALPLGHVMHRCK